ncbi:hypothetical protein DRQ33_06745, partial [bacterium]
FNLTENNRVNVRVLGNIRGQKVGVLEIFPVYYYNPQTGTVEYIVRARINIRFKNRLDTDAIGFRSPVFRKILKDVFPIPVEIPPEPDFPIVYWVIYHDDFYDAIAPFIQWKQQMGYDVVYTPTSEIGTSVDDITAEIQFAYDNWTVPPDFILFVGDIEQIPAHNVGMHYTDLYYCTTDGDDYLPDILYGRFSCATSEQVSAIVEKTLVYEKFIMTSTEFLRRPVFVACGTDGDWELAESTHRYVFETWLTPPEFAPESLWAYDGATGSDVIDATDEGALLINYSGHGWTEGWGNPSVSSSQVYTLTNVDMYPLIISNACLTGKFDEPECFGEAWIRAEQKGAVTFIGASNSTYWGPDDVWERRWYDAIFDEGYTTLTGATYKGNLAVELSGSFGEYYFEVYHNFGDPSLWLYWGEPTAINVDLSDWDGYLPMGEDFYDLPVSEDNALVSIWRDDERMGVDISFGGIAHIVPEFTPAEPGSAIIVATKPNFYAPFVQTVPNEYLAIVEFTPESIQVGVDNNFEIYITDAESLGYEDAVVIISGLEVAETTTTDSLGFASLIVNPPYGIPLTLEAFVEGRRILCRQLPVYGAMDWTLDSLFAEVPAIELTGTLAVGFECYISFSVSETEFRCYVFAGSTEIMVDFSESSGIVGFNPTTENPAIVILAKQGYNAYCDTIPVIYANGPFSGVVIDTAGGTLSVRPEMIFVHGTDTIADFRGNWDGSFSLPGTFPCDTYSVHISAFGYYDTSYTFLLTTRGNYEFRLMPTPRSELFARVKDSEGMPISAEVQLLTSSTGELVGTPEEIETGLFALSSQPFFEYVLFARSRGFSPGRVTFTPESDTTIVEITLESNEYDILLADLTDDGYTSTIMRRNLDSLGYTVYETTEVPDTSQLWRYNVVIVSAGADSNVIRTSQLSTLLDYHSLGGRIIFEGGDLAYQVIAHGTFEPIYKTDLFHLGSYITDVVGDSGLYVNSTAKDSFVFYYPNFLGLRYSTFSGLGAPTYFDVVTPGEDAYLFFSILPDSNEGCISIFPDSEHRGFARSAFFGVSYINAFLSGTVAPTIFSNLLEYILPPKPNMGFVFGNVDLETGAPGNLTQISALGPETVIDSTFADGRFAIQSKPGEYSLSFQRINYRDTTISIYIDPFQPNRVEMMLYRIDLVAETVPQEPFVDVARPNPFNSAVSVKYANPQGENIFARIVDINGRTMK